MTTVKVKFRPSIIPGHEGSIYYQLIHAREQRQIYPDYHILPCEWSLNRLNIKNIRNKDRRYYLMSIQERIRLDLERFNRIITKLGRGSFPFTADDVVAEYNGYKSQLSLFDLMNKLIIKLKQRGQIRTSETYTAALRSFKKFINDEDIMLDCINSDIMEKFEAWHKLKGNVPNTISFYMRILRAVYNRAVEDEIIEDRKPFKRVYTGVDKTIKRALPLSVIKKIKELDLSQNPSLDYARDMFILSFMLRGMSFIDMAFLRKTDKVNGYIMYRRRKTGQQMIIEWTKDMQMILDKYPENKSDYLFPIIKKKGVNEYKTYHNKIYYINRLLKVIGAIVGVSVNMTLYVARHSWATAAKTKGIPISVISEGMGHDNEMTTQIYLASLDTSVVDRANSLILKSLR